MNITKSGYYYYYKNKDTGKYIIDKLPPDFDKRKMRLHSEIIYEAGLYAKVLEIEESVRFYGMRQRKEAFINSVLPVLEYGREDGRYYVILGSNRTDGAQLKMDVNELLFIFPVGRYKTK